MAAWKPGESGNKNGRPRKDVSNLRPLLAKHGQKVLGKVIEAALSGDLVACKLVLDRIYPVIKPQSQTVNIAASGSVAEQGATLMKQTLTGKVAPDISQQIMSVLANQAKLIESTELIERIEALEHAEK